MKKLLSFLAAGALAFGLIGCSGDLHDIDNSPYGKTKSVYVIGGIGKASVDSSQYIGKGELDESSTGFEVPVNNGAFSLEFTYTGEDSWSAGAGNQAFTIVEKAESWTDTGTRWGDGTIAVGSTGSISLSSSNIVLTGLEAGTKYTLTGSLTSAAGTLSLEKGLSGVGMDIINVKDSLMKDAMSASPSGTGDKYTYTYKVNAAEAGELQFVVRVGVNVWVPSKKADLAKGTVKVATPTRFDNVETIDYPITFAYDEWEYGYELAFEYDTTSNALTVTSAKLSGVYINGNMTSGWGAMTPVDADKTAWTLEATGTSLLPSWGPIYGINTTRAYNDGCLRAVDGKSTAIAKLDTEYEIATPANGGNANANVDFTAELRASMKSDNLYKITVTINDGTGTIKISEIGAIPPKMPNLADDGYQLKGNYYNSNWDAPAEGFSEFVETDTENVFSAEFTTTVANVEFGFQNGKGGWITGGGFNITSLDTDFSGVVVTGDADNSHITGCLTAGETYVITITVKDTDGKATARVSKK